MFDFLFVERTFCIELVALKVVVENNTINNEEKEFGEGENCSIEETSLHWIDV